MKKLLTLAVVVATISILRADMIYWMLSDDIVEGKNSRVEAADGSSQNLYAKLMAQQGGSGPIMVAGKSAADVYNAYDLSTYLSTDIGTTYDNTWTFWVETYNGLYSNKQSYDTLVSNGYIAKSGSIETPHSLASGGFGQAGNPAYNIPEPTSGLLFLLGGMLLGLKRRRMA